jgi:TolA-binding protein
MTVFDLHPEELLERAARGVASSAELTRLEQHLAECEVCRVEQALAAQAALDAAPLRDEKLIVARLKRDVAAQWAAPAARRSRRKGALATTILLAATLASVAAAAAVVIVRRAEPQRLQVTAPLPPASQASPARPRLAPPVTVATPEPTQEPPKFEAAREGASELPKPAAAEASSAAELFSRANQARREGKTKEAARLYRALQERFAGSSEELVSRVTLGRLLLDRLGDSRGALLQFNSYLASPGGGALREEAMVGRALALGRIGHTTEERAAWKALLDAWPKSTQAKRAAARLAELGGDDGAGVVRAPANGSSSSRAR